VKYVDVKTVGPDEFQVWAGRDGTMTAVVLDRDTGKLDLNRRAVGLRVRKGYRPPSDPPATFTRQEAARVTHLVGRYFLDLGDLVYSYATVDGLVNRNFFNGRT